MTFKPKRPPKPAHLSLYDWETKALAKWVRERQKLKRELIRRFPKLKGLL